MFHEKYRLANVVKLFTLVSLARAKVEGKERVVGKERGEPKGRVVAKERGARAREGRERGARARVNSEGSVGPGRAEAYPVDEVVAGVDLIENWTYD